MYISALAAFMSMRDAISPDVIAVIENRLAEWSALDADIVMSKLRVENDEKLLAIMLCFPDGALNLLPKDIDDQDTQQFLPVVLDKDIKKARRLSAPSSLLRFMQGVCATKRSLLIMSFIAWVGFSDQREEGCMAPDIGSTSAHQGCSHLYS